MEAGLERLTSMCDCGRPCHRDLDICFRCHIRTVQVSPAATPSRRNNIPPPQSRYNRWENGIAADSRGMPYLDKNLTPIGLKELADNRHTVETQLHKLKHDTNQPSPKE